MDNNIKRLKGSPSRDEFKYWHKQIPNSKSWYSADLDLALNNSKKILGIVDYKKPQDEVTWSESIVYGDLIQKGYKISIVRGDLVEESPLQQIQRLEAKIEQLKRQLPQLKKPEPLKVYSYKEGYGENEVSVFANNDCVEWERQLRNA